MPLRTQLFQQLPWSGGVNTNDDPALIEPGQLVRGDNIVMGTRLSKKPRDGFAYNWDSILESDSSIVGLHEYWFGTNTKTKRFVSVNSAGEVKAYTSGGTATILTVNGKAWEGTIDDASIITFNNKCIIAVNGQDNLIKYWDGASSSIEDLPNATNQALYTNGRSSTGVTRTLVLSETFKGLVGDYIIVRDASGANASFYNGTYQVTSVSTSNVADDTITYIGVGALVEASAADTTLRVDGTAPKASKLREHLGRIFCNDKDNIDRVHYSGSFDHTMWLGFGDSAALDIGIGDGDPEGVSAISPPFKGEIFIGKRTKLYRIRGATPETFQIELITNGIGCVSHNSFALVDQDDLVFVSDKGVHSMNTTSNYGDFSGAYLSKDIQKTFLDNFPKERLKYTKAAYNPALNSIAFAFTDSNPPTFENTSLEINNTVWLYNVLLKGWYRWLDVPCESLICADDTDTKRFYFGSHKNKIIQTATGADYDVDYDGNRQGISTYVRTGQILVDGSLFTVKGFKRFILYYRANGSHNIQVQCKIDNIPVDSVNTLVFDEQGSGDLLGVDFVLGQSVLGAQTKLAPYSRSIDGFGRSIEITVIQDGINQEAEIQGFAIEYETAGTSPEVVRT